MPILTITDSEIIFRRTKDVALHNPYRSPDFIKFVKELNDTPRYNFHHVFGSLGSHKSTDLLGVAVEFEMHMNGHKDRAWIIEQMPTAIDNLIKYVIYLEEKLKHKPGM
jgi:hypothetical protein